MKLKKWIDCFEAYRIVILILLISVLGLIIYMTREDKAGLTCEVINLENGYGYIIGTSTNEVLIYQPYIPAIEKRIAFESRQDAKKVGDAVCERIKKTGIATLTKEEVRHLLHMN